METSRLKLFTTLVETENLRKTASMSNLTPGAASKALKQLEEEFGVELFYRVNKRLILSSEGKRAYEIAKRVLQEAKLLKREYLVNLPDELSNLRLGTYSTFNTYFLGHLTKKCFPNKRMDIQWLFPHAIEKALVDRSIDVGLTSFPTSNEALNIDCVCELKMSIYGLEKLFQNTAFEELPFAVPYEKLNEFSSNDISFDGWPISKARNIKYYVNSLESLLELARQGLAVSIFPSFVVELHNKQVLQKYKLMPIHWPSKIKSQDLKVYLVTRKNDPLPRYYEKLRHELKIICSV